MTDTSPIILTIKAGDNAFDFFLFSLAVYDVLLYNSSVFFSTPSGTTDEVFNKLQGLFLNASQQEGGSVALSFAQLLILLSIVDYISKGLLEPSSDGLISYLADRFPGLANDWVTGYLQNAGHMFSAFRKQFGNSPKMEALLERITRLNHFQSE